MARAGGRTVGIDLGTTNSVVAVLEAGAAKTIANAEGGRTTPSVVAYTKDGSRLVGDVAKRQAVTNVARTIRSAKRHMGTDWSVTIDDTKVTAPEVLAQVLIKLKRDAEAYLNEPVTGAVITVPAYFSDAQRQATKDAGVIAGLEVARIVNEPTAAAIAYGVNLERGETVLVFDLGGGTFDVSLLAVDRDESEFTTVQVIATSGDNHLGGDDWDEALVQQLAAGFSAEHDVDLLTDPVAHQRLIEAAEVAKIQLSSAPVTEVNLPYVAMGDSGPLHLVCTVTRAEFEAHTRELTDRLRGPVEQVIADSGKRLDQIDHVVLVGGATRMPAVGEVVRELTGQEPFRGVSPDEVVATGAALQAGVLTGERDDVLLIDVTPLTLGIETRGGLLSEIIERNTAIPVRRTRTFTTSSDGQSVVRIRAFQGERPMAADNVLLGNLAVTDLPPVGRGVPQIEVAFDIDANGIVSLHATDVHSGTQQSLVITGTSRLSATEIDQMVASAQENAAADADRRAAAEARVAAASLSQQVDRVRELYASRITDEDLAALEQVAGELQEVMQGPDRDPATLRQVVDAATRSLRRLSTDIYQRSGPPVTRNAATPRPDASDQPQEPQPEREVDPGTVSAETRAATAPSSVDAGNPRPDDEPDSEPEAQSEGEPEGESGGDLGDDLAVALLMVDQAEELPPTTSGAVEGATGPSVPEAGIGPRPGRHRREEPAFDDTTDEDTAPEKTADEETLHCDTPPAPTLRFTRPEPRDAAAPDVTAPSVVAPDVGPPDAEAAAGVEVPVVVAPNVEDAPDPAAAQTSATQVSAADASPEGVEPRTRSEGGGSSGYEKFLSDFAKR